MTLHYEDASIRIHKVKCGPYDNNAYLLVCPQTGESIVIDTPASPGKLIETASGTRVRAILITHNHFDHIQGFDEVVPALGAPVGIGEADAHVLPRQPDFFIKHGQTIRAGTIALHAIATPGHTPGSTCFAIGRHLFTGDTLFPGGPGRTRTPEDLKLIIRSITERLFVLPDDVTFYPGHGNDGDLRASREEYRVFASRPHPADLCGDIVWLKS